MWCGSRWRVQRQCWMALTSGMRLLHPGAASIRIRSGWPHIHGPSAKLRKVGPLSTGAKIQKYGWGTADTVEIDMTGAVPAQLTSAEGLFRDRLGLTPDKVKGRGSGEARQFGILLRGKSRHCKHALVNQATSATSIKKAMKGTGVTRVEAINSPAVTDASECFARTSLSSVADITLPAAASVAGLFRESSIGVFNGVITCQSNADAEAIFYKTNFNTSRTSACLRGSSAWQHRLGFLGLQYRQANKCA